MRKRSKMIRTALIAILFGIFGVLNVNAASSAQYEMQLQKVNGLGINTKVNDSITSVQSMAITRNHFVFVMTNTNNENAKNIFYIMDKNTHAFVRQVEVESCGHGNGIAYNETDNVLVVADGVHKKLIVYNADNFTKVKEVGTGSETFNSITYDKDRGMYYLAQNGKSYITRYNRSLVRQSNINVESFNVDSGKNYRINQDLGYANGYIFLTNYVSEAKMESVYSTGSYKATAKDAVIFTYNVVTGEKNKLFYNKAGSNSVLENWKELEGIDFIGDTPYLLFQKGGTFQVYTTDSIKKGISIPDDGKNYKSTCKYEKVRNNYNIDVKYDTNLNKTATGNLKLNTTDKNRELIIVGFSEGKYDDDGKYVQESANYVASSLNDTNIIGKKITYNSTYLNINADAAHKGKILEIKIANGKTDDNCMSYNDYIASNNKNKATLQDSVYIEIIDLTQNQPKEVDNPHYNGVCKIIRNGDSINGKYQDLADIWDAAAAQPNGNYQKLFPYCFEQKTKTPYNKESNVVDAMRYVIEAYNISKMKSEDVSKFESDSFIDAFNKSKARAEAQGHSYNESNTVSKARESQELTCNYKSIREQGANGEYIYDPLNTKSYFGKDVKDVSVTYTYHYDSNHSKDSEPAKVCTKTCYEAVDVEYGAPEAAVAGFAIQYQVKITSRVRCQAEIKIDPPTRPTICQPQPYCVHKNGYAITQGGPEDDYDACIASCDGGKYTQKCSKSCYNKVYGNNSGTKKTAENTTDAKVTQVKVAANQLSNGYYDRDAAGNIKWVGSGYAQWYVDHGEIQTWEDIRNGGRFFYFGDGFKKLSSAKYTDTCGADCSHINCASETYLRQENIESDYVENLKRYNSAVTDCQAAAVCATKSSYYSMEADYRQKEADGKTSCGTIQYPGGKKVPSSEACDNKPTTTFEGKTGSCLKSLGAKDTVQANNGSESVVTCFDGCYKSNDLRNNYLAEITFPGTWVNNKSGEISYNEKKESDGWHYVNGKFFTPLNSASVNTDYWRYYMALQSTKLSSSSVTKSEVVRNQCRDYTTYQMTESNTVTTKNNGPQTYNIRAYVKDFGYFGWNFNVKCFYAIAEYESNTVKVESKNTKIDCYPTIDGGEEPYEIRTVAKEDLFPSDTKGGEGTTDSSKPGRITGFNWSEGAEVIEKNDTNSLGQIVAINKNYVNNPVKVLGDIQSRGVGIYGDGDSDDKYPGNNPYLDYSFYLTPESLKAIRTYGKNTNNNYTDFSGEFKVVGGVNAYYSKLIEELNGMKAVKKVGAPGCNNDNEKDRQCKGIDENRFGSK